MSLLASFVLAVTELVEAEIRAARRGIMRMVKEGLLLAVSVVLLLVGLGFLLGGFYMVVAAATSPSGGAFITGGSVLLVALILMLLARRPTY